MRQLSKSKIISFRQCPKRLWLELHRPELRDDSGSEIVFAIGNQVGDVARQIYDTNGNGKLIDVNELIKRQSITGEPWFDAEGAAADLAPHTGTAYFLDFETISFGVPIWKGTRPYQQLPFQFSLHIVALGGKIEHREFLDISGDDPGEAFSRALIEHCRTEGPIFVYNAGFENGVMRGLAVRFPALSPALLAIVDRVVDLLPIARKRYYHPNQHGTWSLKAVLPAACPDLTYESLDGVKDGQAAQGAFLEAMAPETTPERKKET